MICYDDATENIDTAYEQITMKQKIAETERELAKTSLSPQRRKSLNKYRKRLMQSLRLYEMYQAERRHNGI